MQLGLYTFVESGWNEASGTVPPAAPRMRDLLEEAELADQLGLDVFGVGEHHRADFVVSTPAVVLAAIAARTSRIRLTSAVTVLSSDDPVRVFQEFATVDLISNGRAEIMAGRGSFIESFPLFGYDLDQYNALFSEKLDLLLKLRDTEVITWQGRTRPSIDGRGVYPRPVQRQLPVWIAVGGTPQSVARAAQLGIPLSLAIIGGAPANFVPLIDLYRDSADRAGHGRTLPLAIGSHCFIADSAQKAADTFYPSYAEVMGRIGKERGWPPLSRAQFDALCTPQGALLVGSPQQVIDKILYEHELFGNTRFMAQMTVGPLPHAAVMRSIELFGTVVAPAVRKALGA